MATERILANLTESDDLPPEAIALIEADLATVNYILDEKDLINIFADGDLFRLFRAETYDCPRLKAEEEVSLAQAGDYVSLAFHNIPLVIHFAKRYATRDCPLPDLAQEGFIGLMKAVHKYDPNRINPETGKPYRFSTYAYWWVWQAVKRHAYRERAYTAQIGLEFDAPFYDDGDETNGDHYLASSSDPTPEEKAFSQITAQEIRRGITEAVNHLRSQSPSQTKVFELSSGLWGDSKSTPQIAKELHILEGTVRMYKSQINRRLRKSTQLRNLHRP